jgi:DNA-binding LacI/PurR family transcriptional regulator
LTLIIYSQQYYHHNYPDFHVHHEGLTWELICGVISYCAEHGFDVKLLPLMSSEEAEAKALSRNLGYPYSDGVIFLGYKHLEGAHQIISERKIPAVVIDTFSLKSESFPRVSVDPNPGIKQAIQHLFDKGHRKIAFSQFLKDSNYQFAALRRKAYIREMKKLGIYNKDLIFWTPDERTIKNMAADKKILDSFTAILCVNDPMADRWIRELNYVGISVPKDKAVVGFDNNPAYQELSSIDIQRKNAGREAAQMVIDAIKNDTICRENRILTSKFIARNTI